MATKRRKALRSEGRSMIASVYHFLKNEYDFNVIMAQSESSLAFLKNIYQRTADATGVSTKTVQRVLKQEKELLTPSKFPPPVTKKRKKVMNAYINSISTGDVRKTIQNFHIEHKEIPTLAKLKLALKENIGFDGCTETLRKILKNIGYNWRSTSNNRKVMFERHDMQMSRFKYLRKMSDYRSRGRPIVYTGESFIITPYVPNKNPKQNQKDQQKCTHLRNKFSNGNCFIIVHAGTKEGFIQNASLVYEANTIFGDFRSIMTYDNYVKWLDEKLLPNLPANCVIVLDNVSHHNPRAGNLPTSASKKEELQKWLTEKGIAFDKSFCKLELYDIIKKHSDNYTTYKIDDFIKSKGFDVLRLPRNHPELNAIKNVWAVLKDDVASMSKEENLLSPKEIIEKSMERIGHETWRKSCVDVEEFEKEYLKYFELDIELTNLQDDSDGGDDDNSSSESEFYCVDDSD